MKESIQANKIIKDEKRIEFSQERHRQKEEETE